MRKIELIPGIESSALGFGCAPILGAVGSKTAERALHCALDGGVTHFDVARSYGYGEAEKFLGKFFKGNRGQVIIASKFGIRANWRAGLLRPLKPLVRAMGKGSGSQVAASAKPASVEPTTRRDPFHERVAITPEAMRKSLEQSLRALRSDYLDILSIHEPMGKIEHIEELAEAADLLKKEGKIRGWGLAFDWDNSEELEPTFNQFDVLQFNNSPQADHYQEVLNKRRQRANIFFSPFRTSCNQAPDQVLKELWTDFPNSIILCSMFNPKHIEMNVATANNNC